MNNLVQFNNRNIELIERDGQLYMTGSQIGEVLEYEDAAKAVHNIYTNHKDEFGEDMSCTLKTRVNGVNRLSRVYNREGAWLIGMFARTPKAAEFRKWVLKVLGAVADNQLPTVKVDMKAIGGMVKKCAAVAVRQELANLLAGDKTEQWECSDQDLIYWLHRWHNTKNKAETLEFRRLHVENEMLKQKLLTIKQAVN